MLAPKWLQIVAGLAMFNAVLVAVSLIHRHLVAGEPIQHSIDSSPATQYSVESTDATTITPTAPRSNSLLERLESNAPSVLQSQPLPVADDDPLMAEIRKQVSERFSDLSVTSAPISETTPTANPTPNSDNSSDLQSRLNTIGQLSSAAQGLLKMADDLRTSGKTEQADKAVQQAEQLCTTIRELVQ